MLEGCWNPLATAGNSCKVLALIPAMQKSMETYGNVESSRRPIIVWNDETRRQTWCMKPQSIRLQRYARGNENIWSELPGTIMEIMIHRRHCYRKFLLYFFSCLFQTTPGPNESLRPCMQSMAAICNILGARNLRLSMYQHNACAFRHALTYSRQKQICVIGEEREMFVVSQSMRLTRKESHLQRVHEHFEHYKISIRGLRLIAYN